MDSRRSGLMWAFVVGLVLLAAPAWAQFTPTRATTQIDWTSGAVNCNLPPDVAAGDLLLVVASSDFGINSYTWASPSVEISDTDFVGGALSIARRVAVGGETTVSVTPSGSADALVCHAIRIPAAQWHGTTMPEVSTPQNNGVDQTPDGGPSFNPSGWDAGEETLWIALLGIDNAGTVTAYPTNYTTNGVLQSCVPTSCGLASSWRTTTTASEDVGTWTLDSSTSTTLSVVVAVRPAAVGGGTPLSGSWVLLSGDGWQQINGNAEPVNNFSNIRYDSLLGSNQEVFGFLSVAPGGTGAFLNFLLTDTNNRYRLYVTSVPGTINDTMTLDRLVAGTQEVLIPATDLGLDIAVGDALGAKVDGNTITTYYRSGPWNEWRLIGTKIVTGAPGFPTSSYIAMGGDSSVGFQSFGGGAVVGDITPPTTPGTLTATAINQAEFTDAFTKADEATLGPDLTWTEVVGTAWGVTSNQATVQVAGADNHARAEHDASTADHYVEVTIAAITEGGGGLAVGGPFCRFSASADTAYGFQARLSPSADDYALTKWVAGVETHPLGASIAQVPAVGDRMRLECEGNEIRAYVNGIHVRTVTDSSITTGTRGGMRGIVTGTSTLALDDFSIVDLGSGINLSLAAGSTDDTAVTEYIWHRAVGSCSAEFFEIARTAGLTYTDTSVAAGTLYCYKAQATDAANNLSGLTATASATTGSLTDITPPTAPFIDDVTREIGNAIRITWFPSTDDVGVVDYIVESCVGSGCTSWSQLATTTATTYLAGNVFPANAVVRFRITARDAVPNSSSPSDPADVTTGPKVVRGWRR